MAEAWPDRIFSRYSEVSAALREPNLAMVGARPESRPEAGAARTEIQAGLRPDRISAWQTRLESLAQEILNQAPRDRALDLIADFARPWCRSLAVMATGADESAGERLSELAVDVSAATADPYDAELRKRAAEASAQMEAFFPGHMPPRDASTFVALSQTLVCLLAKCWYELVEHPDEIARLRANPDWMPRAVEELLRFAGMPKAVFRRAVADVEFGAVKIAEGDRVILELAAANRDPVQFPDPDRLDVSRAPGGQLSLGGSGLHSCVGGPLIRMAMGVATSAWVARFAAADHTAAVEWRGGPIFRWPAAVYIRLG